jgi:hypothetical protein
MAERAGFNESGAPLSPPGALSQRTDMMTPQGPMALPDAGYGEQADFQEIQRGAPMAGRPRPQVGMPPEMFADTQQPDVPLTDGADIGPGADSGALGTPQIMEQDTQMIAQYLPQFERMAAMNGTPESFRLFVRYLQGYR